MIEKNNTIDSESANNIEIVTWEDKYAVGVELIDSQHNELVNLTNKLNRACLSGNKEAEAVFPDTMNLMIDYIRFHFSAEEKLMTRINYPDLENHRNQHETLDRNIHEAIKDYQKGNKFVPYQFVLTLRDWVFGHIAISDKQYAIFIEEQKKKGLISEQQLNG